MKIIRIIKAWYRKWVLFEEDYKQWDSDKVK